jgi:signal transduction histidine kinase
MTAPDRKIDVRIDGPVRIMGDRDHIEQVVGNLVDNAVKYSPEGGPILVRLWREGHEVRCMVEDEGIGIPREQLTQIFDLFFRTREAEARRTPGLGLGLYITRSIVERHGGRIWAESEVGKGTRVHVVLPAEHAGERRTVSRPREGAATG